MKMSTTLTEAELRLRLAAIAPGPLQEPFPGNIFNRPRRRAAVLIPMTQVDGQWHLLFIRRTTHDNDHHSGQVAFPGGGENEDDADIRTTALREAYEEVGLRPDDVRVIGALDDVITITNFHVTPVVGIFDSPYPFLPDPDEVDRIFTIPLGWLSQPSRYRAVNRQIEGFEPWPVIYFDEYDGEILWGFTAGLALKLLEALHR